jgi:hypothetical protein
LEFSCSIYGADTDAFQLIARERAPSICSIMLSGWDKKAA